jgi:DNA polymerase III alpha subunit
MHDKKVRLALQFIKEIPDKEFEELLEAFDEDGAQKSLNDHFTDMAIKKIKN